MALQDHSAGSTLAGLPARRTRRRVTRPERRAARVGLVAIAPVAVLLLAVALQSFGLLMSTEHRADIVELFSNGTYYGVLLDTAGYAVLATAIAMGFGLPVAWFAERVARRGAGLIKTVMIASAVMPGYFLAMGWLLLGHTRIGFFPGIGVPLNITSLGGLAFAQGLALASLVFVMMGPAMAALGSSLEESALVHGMSRRAVWRHVWVPLLWPALLATASVTFLVSYASFDIPAVLGLSNRLVLYSPFIYELINPPSGVPQYGIAAASSFPVLLMAVVLTLAYLRFTRSAEAYAVVGGKAQSTVKRRSVRWPVILGWSFCGVFFLLAFALPVLAIAWASLLPFYRPPSLDALAFVSFTHYQNLFSPQFWESVGNTVVFALAAPTITVILALLIAWAGLRASRQVRYTLNIMAFLPLAIPSAILAVGAAGLALAMGSFVPLYGTLLLIILIEAIARIPIASRAISSALIQVNKELDEAGAVFGLRAVKRMLRITLPVIMPAISYTWFLLAILAFRELAVPVLLASKGNITLSVYTYGLLSTGSFGRAAALTLVVMLILAVLIAVAVLAQRVWQRKRLTGA